MRVDHTATWLTWLECGEGRGVEAVPEVLSSPLSRLGQTLTLPGLHWRRGHHLARLELSSRRHLPPAGDQLEGRVLAGGEGPAGAELLVDLLGDLETPGPQDGVGFDFLLISVESRELPLIVRARAAPISQIGGAGAGSCPR